MRTREQLEGVFVVGLCGFLLVGFTWAALVAFGVVAWVTWASALGIGSLVFGLPFGVLAFGKVRVVLGTLEGELYRSTGLEIDLDGDKRTGWLELVDDDRHNEIAEALKTLRPGTAKRSLASCTCSRFGPRRLADYRNLSDGRELDAVKLRDFVVRSKVTGRG